MASLYFETIADEPPVGVTGSGLLSLVHELRQAGVIEPSGRIVRSTAADGASDWSRRYHGRRILLTPDGALGLSQWDIRELQKAKGAIRAAMETLMARLRPEGGRPGARHPDRLVRRADRYRLRH